MSGEGFGSLDQGRHVVLFVAMGVSAHRAWRATRISGFLLFRPPMLASLFCATLRILFFRAGPQDFPYDPRLTAPLAVSAGLIGREHVLTLVTNAQLVFRLLLEKQKEP